MKNPQQGELWISQDLICDVEVRFKPGGPDSSLGTREQWAWDMVNQWEPVQTAPDAPFLASQGFDPTEDNKDDPNVFGFGLVLAWPKAARTVDQALTLLAADLSLQPFVDEVLRFNGHLEGENELQPTTQDTDK